MPQSPLLSVSRRTRRTPFTTQVEAHRVKAYTIYNHMLLPTVFESVEADYHHLKKHVQVWDVACERQVEIIGVDAEKLVQMITPRYMQKMAMDQCFYIPAVDEKGCMLNDPVTLKFSPTHWWVSIADSDLLLYLKGLALGARLNVSIDEPDVSPLAIQGPQANTLMARLFGEKITQLGFFRQHAFSYEGKEYIIARSGYSGQGGFEIYVNGSENGAPLWDALFHHGADLNVRAGCPNLIERIEAGLLSYGNDMTRANSPYECGLERFFKDISPDCIGANALQAQKAQGIKRKIHGLHIAGEPLMPCRDPWPLYTPTGEWAGQVSSACYSPDLATNIAIAMIEAPYWGERTPFNVHTPQNIRKAQLCSLPFK